jgi:lipolytic protein G-D-S-L family
MAKKKKKKSTNKTNTRTITKKEINKLLEDNNLIDKNNDEEKKEEIQKRIKRNESLYTDEVEIVETNEKEDIIDKDVVKEIEEEEALNEKLEEEIKEDLSETKQQKFNFEDNQVEDEMDMSFLTNKPRKKNTNIVEKTVYSKSLVIVIIILVVCFLGFIIFHYTTFNHHKVKVVTKIKEVEKVPDNYLFLGDSITDFYDLDKYYKDLPVVNSGISGNTTDDILKDMKKRAYQYNPSKVFLLIGTNDLDLKHSKEDVIGNIEKILEEIKSNRPKAELYLESIYPVNHDIRRNNAGNRKNSDIKEINEKLEDYCEDNDITYIDMYDLLKDEEGNLKEEYTKDGLHLSDKGYEVVTKEIKQIIS